MTAAPVRVVVEIDDDVMYRMSLLRFRLTVMWREYDERRRELLRRYPPVDGRTPQEVPAGRRLVPTGRVTVCCGSHRPGSWPPDFGYIPLCCDPDDCGSCCRECPTCPRT